MFENFEIQRRRFLAAAVSGIGSLWMAKKFSFGTLFGKFYKNNDNPVSLKEAHIGSLEIDLRIMNQFGEQPAELQTFYTDCRRALTGNNPQSDLLVVCHRAKRSKLGGPFLGDITPTSLSVWMHLAEPTKVKVVVTAEVDGKSNTFTSANEESILTVRCDGLSPDTVYTYQVFSIANNVAIGKGRFVTPPKKLSDKPFRIAFGADFHKIGMYRPELMKLIRERQNRAMLLIGDSAVDGRKDDFGLIGTDYLLRNLSPPLQTLMANVPVSATWDDHDYWGNDVSGSYAKKPKTPIDVDGLRRTWKLHWNNPEREVNRNGIYFQTKIGPIHHIALDTRSCRVNDRRGKINSFLGAEQMAWLKDQITTSESPFILISGGTMWSDYISAGKDSWGTWDREGREEIFKLIDGKRDSKVILMSGDRHGARGFAIPRPDNQRIVELEVGTLGGVPGPAAFADDRQHQLFGLPSKSWAFGELTFSLKNGSPHGIFRLINEQGKILETVTV